MITSLCLREIRTRLSSSLVRKLETRRRNTRKYFEVSTEQLEIRSMLSANAVSVAPIVNEHVHVESRSSHERGRAEATEPAKAAKKTPKIVTSQPTTQTKPTQPTTSTGSTKYTTPTKSTTSGKTTNGKSTGRGIQGSDSTLSQGYDVPFKDRNKSLPPNPWTPFGRPGDYQDVGQAIWDAYQWFDTLTSPLDPKTIYEQMTEPTRTGIGPNGDNWDEYFDRGGNPTAAGWKSFNDSYFLQQSNEGDYYQNWIDSLPSGSGSFQDQTPYFNTNDSSFEYWNNASDWMSGHGSGNDAGSGASIYYDDNAPGRPGTHG